METTDTKLLLKDEVYAIVGAAIEVLNGLGHGLVEKPYENALVVEFKLRGIPFAQQPRFEVVYKGVQVGEFVPDLITYDAVVVDAKVRPHIGSRARSDAELPAHHGQTCRRNPEFLEREAGMGKARPLIRVHWCPFVVKTQHRTTN